jgi:HSP20 family protein
MANTVTKLPIRKEESAVNGTPTAWRPFETFKHELDRLFDDFGFGGRSLRRGRAFEPLWQDATFTGAPAVDVAEKAEAFEVTAELPGMDEKEIEVKVSNGMLTITGETKEEREENKKDYFLSERRYGTFQRTFGLPEGVDPERIEASFTKGVLTVTLPKSPEAQRKEKRIAVVAR